ncbi:helix-turn-helix domain-containing protein [Amycolatopsis taiwanensis]|uniref:helix-turn-helix domain-containing protein n=1 Tax=Amycolatopsis taiwanensis TaxID=342230 RepID=UPI003D7F775F
MSVRYLHKVFEGEGTTISRWIQQRRLEECSRELARRHRVIPTVSAVAQRWGFVNPAHTALDHGRGRRHPPRLPLRRAGSTPSGGVHVVQPHQAQPDERSVRAGHGVGKLFVVGGHVVVCLGRRVDGEGEGRC